MPSKVGTTRWCGTRIRFSDTVGTLLIISSAIPVTVIARSEERRVGKEC